MKLPLLFALCAALALVGCGESQLTEKTLQAKVDKIYDNIKKHDQSINDAWLSQCLASATESGKANCVEYHEKMKGAIAK